MQRWLVAGGCRPSCVFSRSRLGLWLLCEGICRWSLGEGNGGVVGRALGMAFARQEDPRGLTHHSQKSPLHTHHTLASGVAPEAGKVNLCCCKATGLFFF